MSLETEIIKKATEKKNFARAGKNSDVV